MKTPPAEAVTSDALTWLAGQASGSADLIITDPPYESLERHRAIGTTTRLKRSKGSSNDWFEIFPNSRFAELFQALHRVSKRNSHLYVFSDHVTFPIAKEAGEAAGYRFWKPLVWDKKLLGMGYHYRCRYEFILFFEKGKRKLKDLSIPDILEVRRVRGGYPTEKPVGLLEQLVLQSSCEGDTVVDPFCGSGSTGVAAINHGRRFAGCDKLQSAVEATNARLRDVAAQRKQTGAA